MIGVDLGTTYSVVGVRPVSEGGAKSALRQKSGRRSRMTGLLGPSQRPMALTWRSRTAPGEIFHIRRRSSCPTAASAPRALRCFNRLQGSMSPIRNSGTVRRALRRQRCCWTTATKSLWLPTWGSGRMSHLTPCWTVDAAGTLCHRRASQGIEFKRRS